MQRCKKSKINFVSDGSLADIFESELNPAFNNQKGQNELPFEANANDQMITLLRDVEEELSNSHYSNAHLSEVDSYYVVLGRHGHSPQTS